jgi:hypothetical protein
MEIIYKVIKSPSEEGLGLRLSVLINREMQASFILEDRLSKPESVNTCFWKMKVEKVA